MTIPRLSSDSDPLSLLLSEMIRGRLAGCDFNATILAYLKEMMEFVQGVVLSIEASGKSPAVSCSEGCSYCCHSQVNITPLETLLIHGFVRKQFTCQKIAQLHTRIDTAMTLTQGKTLKQRFQIKTQTPCVFLSENQCSIYPVRPFICRSWNSLDQATCKTAFYSTNHHIEIVTSPMRNYVFQTTRDLFEDCCARRNLETGTHDIPFSMRTSLSAQDPFACWAAGKIQFGRP